METISTAIRSMVNDKPDGDPEAMARQLLKKYQGAALLRLIAREIGLAQRALVRGDEKTAFSAFFKAGGSAAQFNLEAFSKLFGRSFRLGGGLRASWGEATIAQHETRIALLTKLRDGVEQSITRHREAIRIISEAGAKCLNDIQQRKAA